MLVRGRRLVELSSYQIIHLSKSIRAFAACVGIGRGLCSSFRSLPCHVFFLSWTLGKYKTVCAVYTRKRGMCWKGREMFIGQSV